MIDGLFEELERIARISPRRREDAKSAIEKCYDDFEKKVGKDARKGDHMRDFRFKIYTRALEIHKASTDEAVTDVMDVILSLSF